MADTKTTFGFEHKGIGQVLSHYRLVVPLNQREYAWEDEHVRDLFQDFAAALDKARGTYFLGTVVLTRGEHGTLEVSDGQQRLATTTILLAAIRDYLFLNGHKKRADSLQPFLGEIDFSTEKTVPKLTLNVDDNDYFVRRVLSEPGSEERKKVEPTKDSHRKIDNAAILAAEHVAAILKPIGKEAHAERLGVWKDFIESGAEVILLSVPDHLNAFVMFETLNDRGLKASQADLLKNHLLRHAGSERMREAQQKWSQMVGALESLTEDDMTVSYLRSLLIAKFGPTREREVFNRVKEEVGSQQRALDFLQELKDGASDFVAMLNPNHRKWNEYNPSTRKHVAQLLGLRVEQIRPLLFAVSRYFDPKEAAKAFKLFVSWSVRFLIAGGRGGTLDSNYARVAHEVGTRKITDAAGLAASMKEIVPSDAVFEASFGDAIVSRSFLARYYLRALELRVKGEAEPELVPNEEEQVINLEHVLPENPGTGWPGVAPDVASAYYKRLGNMVLLQATKNSTLGNSPFADKQKILSESAFMLTQDVGKSSHWTEKEIAERQKKLAKLAVETWPIEVR